MCYTEKSEYLDEIRKQSERDSSSQETSQRPDIVVSEVHLRICLQLFAVEVGEERRRIRLMARSYRSVTNCRRSTSSTKQKMKISMWALKNEKFRIVDILMAESKINLPGDPGTLTFVQFFVVFSSQEQHRSDKSDLVIW